MQNANKGKGSSPSSRGACTRPSRSRCPPSWWAVNLSQCNFFRSAHGHVLAELRFFLSSCGSGGRRSVLDRRQAVAFGSHRRRRTTPPDLLLRFANTPLSLEADSGLPTFYSRRAGDGGGRGRTVADGRSLLLSNADSLRNDITDRLGSSLSLGGRRSCSGLNSSSYLGSWLTKE